jgi:hypothetical protein
MGWAVHDPGDGDAELMPRGAVDHRAAHGLTAFYLTG